MRDGDDPEGATFVFPCGRWFDVGQDDGEIERELLPGEEQGKLYTCTTLILIGAKILEVIGEEHEKLDTVDLLHC